LNENKNKKEKEPIKKIAMRVVCLVLAITMIASTLFYLLAYLVNALNL
jgi:preprotein translocase subunit SecE